MSTVVAKSNAAEVAKGLTRHVNNVLMATAYAQLKREAVDKIERQVLCEFEYMSNPELTRKPSERITEPSDTYLMIDSDFTDYHEKVQAIHLANGYADAAKGYCPALVAENLKMKAEHVLIEAAGEYFPGVTKDRLLCGTAEKSGMDMLREFIDLLIKLVVNAPGYERLTPQQWLALAQKVDEDDPEHCPDCNREVTGPVPPYCRKHDGDYSSWLARNNID